MINNDLLYYIPSGEFGKEGVLGLLKTHPEIRFVSLVGIDLAAMTPMKRCRSNCS